jgi:hypothetical protein
MCRRRSILIAGALLAAAAPSAHGLDMKHVSCTGFLASGQDDMKAIIMWLRGYHHRRYRQSGDDRLWRTPRPLLQSPS